MNGRKRKFVFRRMMRKRVAFRKRKFLRRRRTSRKLALYRPMTQPTCIVTVPLIKYDAEFFDFCYNRSDYCAVYQPTSQFDARIWNYTILKDACSKYRNGKSLSVLTVLDHFNWVCNMWPVKKDDSRAESNEYKIDEDAISQKIIHQYSPRFMSYYFTSEINAVSTNVVNLRVFKQKPVTRNMKFKMLQKFDVRHALDVDMMKNKSLHDILEDVTYSDVNFKKALQWACPCPANFQHYSTKMGYRVEVTYRIRSWLRFKFVDLDRPQIDSWQDSTPPPPKSVPKDIYVKTNVLKASVFKTKQ